MTWHPLKLSSRHCRSVPGGAVLCWPSFPASAAVVCWPAFPVSTQAVQRRRSVWCPPLQYLK
eukprot:1814263-Amphidinium_carterae.1